MKPVNCGCTSHTGRQLSDNTYPIPVDTAFTLMFTESKFFKRSCDDRGITGLMYTQWLQTSGCNTSRIVKYQVPLNHTLFKVANTTETQTLITASTNQLYKILVSAQNSELPYSDSFRVETLYCLTRGETEDETRVTVHSTVVFTGSGWSFKLMKPIIEKEAYQGISNHVAALIESLTRYCTRRPSIIGEIIDAEQRSLSGNSHRSPSPYLNRIRIEEPDSRNCTLTVRGNILSSLTHKNDSRSVTNSLKRSTVSGLTNSLHSVKLTQSIDNVNHRHTLSVLNLLNEDISAGVIKQTNCISERDSSQMSKSAKLTFTVIFLLFCLNVFLYLQLNSLENSLDIIESNKFQANHSRILLDNQSLRQLQTFIRSTVDALTAVERSLQHLHHHIHSLHLIE